MKILVIGGSGVIGLQIIKHCLKQKVSVEFTYLTHAFGSENIGHYLDITNREDVLMSLTKTQPDIVIHTVALTNVDLCENNKPLANSINVDGTRNVIEACKKTNSKLVYISTSSVFDGKKEKYFETDRPSPTSHYGITKLKGEEFVKDSGIPHLILRTDQPYCWTEKWQHTNSVLRVLDKVGSGETFNEITDWYNTPTYVPDFVKAAFALVNENAEGIFHLVGSDFISRYDCSLQVADIFKLNKKLIRPIQSDKLGLPVKRSNVYLSNDKIHHQTGIKMCDIKEGLNKMLMEMNTSKNDMYENLRTRGNS